MSVKMIPIDDVMKHEAMQIITAKARFDKLNKTGDYTSIAELNAIRDGLIRMAVDLANDYLRYCEHVDRKGD